MHFDFDFVEQHFLPFDHALVRRVEVLVADVDELRYCFGVEFFKLLFHLYFLVLLYVFYWFLAVNGGLLLRLRLHIFRLVLLQELLQFWQLV